MPLAISTSETFGLVLKSDLARDDEGKALEPQPPGRPTFLFHHLSGRRQRELAARLDAFEAGGGTTVEAVDQAFAMLAELLVGWRDVAVDGEAVEFRPDRISDVLQHQEATELVYGVWGYRPTAADLGNSPSPSA